MTHSSESLSSFARVKQNCNAISRQFYKHLFAFQKRDINPAFQYAHSITYPKLYFLRGAEF